MKMENVGSALRILLVDHKKEHRDAVKKLLGEEYSYEEVETGKDAVSYIDANADIIVLIMLNPDIPDMDGLQIIKEVEKKGLAEQIPIIAVSEGISEEMANRAYDMGIADIFDVNTKLPAVPKRISNTIRLYMNSKLFMLNQLERDMLTGMYNLRGLRRHFYMLAERMTGKKFHVIYTDIKNFKYFNNAFNYEQGNEILQKWCKTIQKYCGEDDLIGRLTGDQIVIVTEEKESDKALDTFHSILTEMREHFAGILGEYTIDIYAGVYPVVLNEDVGSSLDEMIGYARQAQNSVKGNSESCCAVYDHAMWVAQQRKIEINAHLKKALKNGEVVVYLQPQYNYVTGELVGAECLCRWKHEKYGFLSPAEFIPALEETGKIFDLDYFVWEKACQYMRKWLDEGRKLSLAVNVSRKDINSADLPELFAQLVRKYDLPPGMLRIEITESVYMDEATQLIELVGKLSENGFSVEMDDFGSGFSSLNLLQDIAVDVLKLDMGFLRESDQNARSGSIINAVVKMAHVLGITVLAEGVETVEQADFLKSIGCLLAQGYYFSKPIPVEDFEELLGHTYLSELSENSKKYQLFNIQELFDRNSSGFFIFNNCMGAASLFEYDGKTLQTVIINDAFVGMIQREREEMERNHQDILMLFPEDKREEFRHVVEKALEDGYATGELYSAQMNRYLYIAVRHIAARDDAELCFCEAKDVTNERLMENKLRTEQLERRWYEKKIQAVMEVPGIVLYEYDPAKDSMIVSVRTEEGEMHEHKAERYLEELAQRKWIHDDDLDIYMDAIRDSLKVGSYHCVTCRALFLGGEYHLCKYHFTSVADDEGKVYRVIGRAERLNTD